jgi:hypothetical protein
VAQAGETNDYSLKQASEYLGVSERTLGNWCREGRWKTVAYKVESDKKGQWWIPYAAVHEVFLEKRGNTVDAEQEEKQEPSKEPAKEENEKVAVIPPEVVTAMQSYAGIKQQVERLAKQNDKLLMLHIRETQWRSIPWWQFRKKRELRAAIMEVAVSDVGSSKEA